MKSSILEAAKRKGYTGTYLCAAINSKLGMRMHPNVFRRAVTDKPNKSRREEWITECALDLVRELPDLSVSSDRFSVRARSSGYTVKDVWEYYAARKEAAQERVYNYHTFLRSTNNPIAPYERKIADEAEGILAEMIAKKYTKSV